MKTLHWITFAPKIVFPKIIFCTCTYGKISISQEFFLLAKKLKLFILYRPWLLEKNNQTFRFSGICHVIKTKQKTNKVSNSRNWSLIHFSNFSMAFRNTLLEQIVKMPDLSGHWLYNFNILGDKKNQWLRQTKLTPPK